MKIKSDEVSGAVLFQLAKLLAREGPRCGVRELCVLQYLLDNEGCAVSDVALAMFGSKNSATATQYIKRWKMRGWLDVREGIHSGGSAYVKGSIRLTDKAHKMLTGEKRLRLEPYGRRSKAEYNDQVDGKWWVEKREGA